MSTITPQTIGEIAPRSFVSTAVATAQQRMKQLLFGMADQGFAVGGMFLVNVVLARTQSKEDYGTFALSYSIFTFLAGLHNSAVLEPFTVYASGRYRDRFASYWRLMMTGNVVIGLILSVALGLIYVLLGQFVPFLRSRSILGLALTMTFILSGSFLRRSFYVRGQPALSARAGLVFFVAVTAQLWVAARIKILNGFWVFLILALGWLIAGLTSYRKLPSGDSALSFLEDEPGYWHEHWGYTRWVLATAFVYQFTHQGYYWLLAAFLSVREVGELKAMYVLIAPIEQVMISMSFLFLPALAARYSAQNQEAFVSFWRKWALLVLGVTSIFALGVRLTGTRLLHLLYAGKFDELGPLLFLLALVPLCMGIGNTAGDAIRAAEKPHLVFYAYVSSAIATFLIGIPLVIFFGLRGAAWGMIVSASTYSIALLIAFRLRVYRTRPMMALDAYSSTPTVPSLEDI